MLFKYTLEVIIDSVDPSLIEKITDIIKPQLMLLDGIKSVLPTVTMGIEDHRDIKLTLAEYNELLEYKSMYKGLEK